MITATCPNDPTHDRFQTVAHIAQDWIVDRNGEFLEMPENPDEQTVAAPTVGNTWTCVICGAEADVE